MTFLEPERLLFRSHESQDGADLLSACILTPESGVARECKLSWFLEEAQSRNLLELNGKN
jgi:hypothetical protein